MKSCDMETGSPPCRIGLPPIVGKMEDGNKMTERTAGFDTVMGARGEPVASAGERSLRLRRFQEARGGGGGGKGTPPPPAR
jgi:hypothetical protein